MENIVTYLKLVRGMKGVPLAYMVRQHMKVAHISEMIARAPIVNICLNLKMTQDLLDRAYLVHGADTFKIDNAMVYQILSKIFTDMNAFVHMKQRRATQDY